MHKPFLLVIPHKECYYYASEEGFYIKMKNPLDYVNCANIEVQGHYEKSVRLDLTQIKSFIRDSIREQTEDKKSIKKAKKVNSVINRYGEEVNQYPLTPSEAFQTKETQNNHLLLIRRLFK